MPVGVGEISGRNTGDGRRTHNREAGKKDQNKSDAREEDMRQRGERQREERERNREEKETETREQSERQRTRLRLLARNEQMPESQADLSRRSPKVDYQSAALMDYVTSFAPQRPCQGRTLQKHPNKLAYTKRTTGHDPLGHSAAHCLHRSGCRSRSGC